MFIEAGVSLLPSYALATKREITNLYLCNKMGDGNNCIKLQVFDVGENV